MGAATEHVAPRKVKYYKPNHHDHVVRQPTGW